MRISQLRNVPTFCVLKVIVGSVIVFNMLLSGVTMGGCPPNVNCLWSLEFYSMRLDTWSVVAAILSIGLLLSAFKDLLKGLTPIELLERNVESIADID